MQYSENSLEIMKQQSEQVSKNISNYILDNEIISTETLYPYDPSIKYQNSGLYKNEDPNFMDINSEILNITNPLTNDVIKKWNGANKVRQTNQPEEILFSTKYTRMDEPPSELRGKTKNRWLELPIDPQENSIEPFQRNGINTYLRLIDNYNC